MRKAFLTISLLLASAPLLAQGVCPADPPTRLEKGPYRTRGFELTSEQFDDWLLNVRAMCDAQPWTVSRGGTGQSSLTAYAPLFGGTTATGAIQSGTLGTAGWVLTSNGAAALPTFQAPTGGSDDQTAAEVPITDASNRYTGTNVETALQEIPRPVRTLWVDKAGRGDYTTIKAAVDFVNTQTHNATNLWNIVVIGGNHGDDPAWTQPTYTTVLFLGAEDETAEQVGLVVKPHAAATYGLFVRGSSPYSVYARNDSATGYGVYGRGPHAVYGLGLDGVAVEGDSDEGGTALKGTSDRSTALDLSQTHQLTAPLVDITRSSASGNHTAHLVDVLDDHTSNSGGAISGDVLRVRTGGGGLGAVAERFAIERDGDIRCASCIEATDLAADSVAASELDAAAVESELEAALDLADQQGALPPAKLGAVDSPGDEECYTYESTGATGEWQSCGGSGGGSSSGTGLQYGDGAGGFAEVMSSVVSGANVTLAGTLGIGSGAAATHFADDTTFAGNTHQLLVGSAAGTANVKGVLARRFVAYDGAANAFTLSPVAANIMGVRNNVDNGYGSVYLYGIQFYDGSNRPALYQPNINALAFASGQIVTWSSSATEAYPNQDTSIGRVGAGLLGVRNGSTGGAAISFVEQAAPAAPATNGAYLYAQDDGSGKTQLCVRFATGAAQCFATEP